MTELHKLEEYSMETISSFIENEIEESIHIEFKSGEALNKADSSKKEVSKDVSAFANSDGGIIIYGISEKNHKASHFTFVDGNIYTKEWLEQIINTTVKRIITNLKIFPVRHNGKISETIYVVQIPSSIDAPHLSRDKKFYKRYNFESVPMEEYEIRGLYGRKVKSELILWNISLFQPKQQKEGTKTFIVEVGVHNDGEKMEVEYKVNLYILNYKNSINISWSSDNSTRNYNHTRMDDNRVKISANSFIPIYPNETITVLRFYFSIEDKDMIEAAKDLKLEARLFYPGGEDKMETELEETILNVDYD